MTNCCRNCSKLLCKDYGKKEKCSNCVSYTLLEIKKIDKNIKED